MSPIPLSVQVRGRPGVFLHVDQLVVGGQHVAEHLVKPDTFEVR